jgi:ribonuclease P protein component
VKASVYVSTNFQQWISWWWRKGVADLDNRALSEALENYGVAIVAWLAGPDSPHSGLSTPDQSAAWAALPFHSNLFELRN